jgi:hypothetical protein
MELSSKQSTPLRPTLAIVSLLTKKHEEESKRIDSIILPLSAQNLLPVIHKPSLWAWLQNEKKFVTLTNFDEVSLSQLFQSCVPAIRQFEASNKRSRCVTIWQDHLITLLAFYKHACKRDFLAMTLQTSATVVAKRLLRFREILHKTLVTTWFGHRIRPRPLQDTAFPFVGLLLDSTSIQVFKPTAPFKEAKAYWDGKNQMYALKKEVAVTAAPPHYAIFIQPATNGSIHDYKRLRGSKRVQATYPQYVEYLKKHPNEYPLLPNDDSDSWALLADTGYAATDSPAKGKGTFGLRRITPKKNPKPWEEGRNAELCRLRVYVECFFGRAQQLWQICAHRYRWSHKFFDTDIDNAFLLTNEIIGKYWLTDADRVFYRSRNERHQKRMEERRARAQQLYGASKRKNDKEDLIPNFFYSYRGGKKARVEQQH